jgi:hypothetical protein
MTAEDLGLVYTLTSLPADQPINASSDSVILTREQATMILALLELREDNMAHFDPQRRSALLTALQAAGTATVVIPHILDPEPWERLTRASTQPLNINEQALEQFAALTRTCWQLHNANQTVTVAHLLPTFLPQMAALAQQASIHQKKAAEIATQGYLLASFIYTPACMRYTLSIAQRYSKLAVQYSEVAEDFSLRVAALRDHAIGACMAAKTEEELETYLRALPFLPFVSPLVQSRLYMSIASAYAACGKHNDTLACKYLELGHQAHPSQPEADPSYLYIGFGLGPAVLHLSDGRTYIALGRYQDAWDSLEQVNALTPKMAIPESLRIEVINHQANAAVGLGELETSLTCVEAAVEASEAQGYNLWQSEAHEVFQNIQKTWPHEKQVQRVAERFRQ